MYIIKNNYGLLVVARIMTHTAISEIMNYFLSITKTMNWDFHYT